MDLVKSAGLMFFYQAALIIGEAEENFLGSECWEGGTHRSAYASNFFSVIRIGTSCIIPYRSNLETSFR